jgi:hypothetical protein
MALIRARKTDSDKANHMFMKLYRQPKIGDWKTPLEQVRRDLNLNGLLTAKAA